MKTRRILTSLVLVLLLTLLAAIGTTALADWSITYVDADGTIKTCEEADQVLPNATTLGNGSSTPCWYYVEGNTPYKTSGITISGNVHLVLMDDCYLFPSSNGSIIVNTGSSLTIYAQQNNTGKLTAKGINNAAGIGSGNGKDAGTITINGGIIEATGGENAAGIGAGANGKANGITINGGIITATGGSCGAGIGCGLFSSTPADAAVKMITINGGAVSATGLQNAAGIGGGKNCFAENILITGGTVKATSDGSDAARSAIGGGANASKPSSNIKVTNTDMQLFTSGATYQGSDTDRASDLKGKDYACADMMPATNVSYVDAGGATQTASTATRILSSSFALTLGNGSSTPSWYVVEGTVSTGLITIDGNVHLILKDGASLTTIGEQNYYFEYSPGIRVVGSNSLTIYGQSAQTGKLTTTGGRYGAGIGTGQNETTGKITINGGDIDAKGGQYGAGIGGGRGGNLVDLTINAGTIRAQSGNDSTIKGSGAGIGAGFRFNSTKVYAKNIVINGGTITAIGGFASGAGIGCSTSGYVEGITINGGEINAQGVTNSAGIGCSSEGYVDGVTITAGKVTATGGSQGAGIGSGAGSDAKNITISGGTVNATGKEGGAGIGGGINAKGEDILITGGSVTAESVKIPDSILETKGDAIGSGTFGTASNNIKLTNVSMCLYAGESADSTTVYPGSDNDLASNLSGKPYATTNTPPLKNVPYIDADGTQKICSSAIKVKSATAVTTLGDGTANPIWYAVDGTVTTDSITVNGNVHLILVDGASLTATTTTNNTPGICVEGTNTLTIYGQAGQTGKLTATSAKVAAGIGSRCDTDSGAITINGGVIFATGGSNSAGIGTGNSVNSVAKDITINNGQINAKGNGAGAGIGGGNNSQLNGLTINGGTVIAEAPGDGAGIGGGYSKNASNITITGGTVTAISSGAGAGIGGGGYNGNASDITITDGTVTAISNGSGAGIGGGKQGNAQKITITGGLIKAESKSPFSSSKGNAIGNGNGASGSSNIIFNHSTMYLHAGPDASSGILIASSTADISESLAGKPYAETVLPEKDIPYIDADGSQKICPVAMKVNSATAVITLGDGTANESWYVVDGDITTDSITVNGNVHLILKDGASLTATATAEDIPGIRVEGTNTLTIYGQAGQTGKLTATGASFAAGFGSGKDNDSGAITINGGVISANSGFNGAGIGTGFGKSKALTAYKITINGGYITAKSTGNGSGIGGGNNGHLDGLTINGGTVIATGNGGGAGIGGGYEGNAVNIKITGGDVSANGFCGAGIGGGASMTKQTNKGYAQNIEITGGTIVAISNPYSSYPAGAGIGSGYNGVASSSIKISDELAAYIGDDEASAIAVISEDEEWTDDLQGKPYARIEPRVPVSDPVVTPSIASVSEGEKATFFVKADGDDLRYQWYINRQDGLGWQKLDGAVQANYTTTETKLENNGYEYYCVVTYRNGRSYDSNTVMLQVVKNPPKTGDSASPILWAGLGMLSLGLMLTIVLSKKRVIK